MISSQDSLPHSLGDSSGHAGSEDGGAASSAFPPDLQHVVDTCLALQGGLLPALHAVQDHYGFVSSAAVQGLADQFNVSRADVHGVVTFYPHFRTSPAGRHVVQICRAEACQSMASNVLAAHAMERLNCQWHETSPDGLFTLEPVYCLGLCAQSPAVMIDGAPHARVTPQKLDQLFDTTVASHTTEAP